MSDKQFDDALEKIIKEDKPLKVQKAPKQTTKKKVKKETPDMKKLINKPAVIVVVTVIVTLAAVWGVYSLYQMVYHQGYNDAVQHQQKVQAEVKAASKTNQ